MTGRGRTARERWCCVAVIHTAQRVETHGSHAGRAEFNRALHTRDMEHPTTEHPADHEPAPDNAVIHDPATGQPADILVVAADHPSLAGDIDAFLDRVQLEQRYFGPTARSNPKPFRSLMASLRERGGFRMAAIECGRIVGLARVDAAGELFLVVGAEHRGRGIGTALGGAMAARASDLQFTRLVLRTSRRSLAARRVGEELGAVVLDRGRGRTELILDLLPGARSA